MNTVWEVRGLTGTLTVKNPDTGRYLTTTGGYVAVDTGHKADPVGPFRSARKAAAWVAAQQRTAS